MLFVACQQDDAPSPAYPVDKPYQLKTIAYKNSGATGQFTYNADSSLKQIAWSSSSAAADMFYEYEQGKMVKTGMSNSLYTHHYYYNGNKVIKVVTQTAGTPGNGYYMEYTYNVKGQVVTQKYFKTNEAGTQLKSNSDYVYDANGLLTSITTDDGNTKFTFKIEAYSDEYALAPWAFIPHSLSEFYPIYNHPVITSMKRLPAKIVKSQKVGAAAEETTRIDQQLYTITNKKITRLIQITDYPGHPELHVADTATFSY